MDFDLKVLTSLLPESFPLELLSANPLEALCAEMLVFFAVLGVLL